MSLSDSGSEITRQIFRPFGELAKANSAGFDLDTRKYTGQELDEESGLHYYGARYYDGRTGRFLTGDSELTSDPYASQRYNRFSYALNNPVTFVDPTGHTVLPPHPPPTPLINHPFAFRLAAELRKAASNVAPDIFFQLLTPNGAAAAGLNAVADWLDPKPISLEQQAFLLQLSLIPGAAVVEDAEAIAVEAVATESKGRYIPRSQVMRERNGVVTQVRAAVAVEASTADQLAAAATRARATVGPGSGPVHGTLTHSAFKAEVDSLGRSNLNTEVSYLNGEVVQFGTKGSVRLDVVEGPLDAPRAVYDLKTGTAGLTQERIAEIRNHVPGGANIPILEIR